ncbi:4Fe-4S dicluster domain-containing protein [Chloroflexota bacterium]
MNISRRNFLKGAGLAAGGAAVVAVSSTSNKVLANENFTGHPNRFGMLIDTTMCVGCRSCERACNRANDLPPPEKRFSDPSVFEIERRPSSDAHTVVARYPSAVLGGNPIYRKGQCMHCEEPACVSSCLVGALKKTPEGAVIYNEDVCIGCRYCVNACPFYMLSYEYDDPVHPAVTKCDMCFSRITEGQEPACTSGCPVQAIIFGERSDLLQTARMRINNNPGRYVNHIYGENEAGGTGALYLSAVPFENIGLPTNLGETPYPEYTRDFLLSVPAILIGWPALFLGLNALSKRREAHAAEIAQDQEKETR